MKRLFRAIMPLVPMVLSVLAAIDAVMAFQTGRIGRGAFKMGAALVWLFIAYMLYAMNKRIPSDDK